MQKYSRIERFSRWYLVATYHLARLLGVINCRFDRHDMVVHHLQRRSKIAALILRLIIIGIYWSILPNLFRQFLDTPESYVRLIASMQTITVTLFTVFLFVVQTRGEKHVIAVLNRFLKLAQRIAGKTGTGHIYAGHFLFLLLLKIFATLVGYINEIPALLHVDQAHDPFQWASVILGVYMWLGSMFVLDVCFLGFLTVATLYAIMGDYLRTMLQEMHYIEVDADENPFERRKLSHYMRMRLLCEYADRIDDCGAIYSELYQITKQFQHIFQYQILYYLHYNFMVILLLLHQCIWLYIHSDYIHMPNLFIVVVKILNLALLIMMADYAVQKSQLPGLLCLDLVCSDIDARWDMSVETFLNQRKTENLEIKVLGFFQLNNQFILLILSAIISYLFILIQFGLSGGFEENNELKTIVQSHQSH